jgi:hypothetical protein
MVLSFDQTKLFPFIFHHHQYERAGCMPFHHQQYGCAGCIPFHYQQYGRAGYIPFHYQQYGRAGCIPLHYQQYGRTGCIPFHYQQYGRAGCIPFHYQQYGRAGCIPPRLLVWTCRLYPYVAVDVCVDVQGVSLSIACNILSTCIKVYPLHCLQCGRNSVYISTACSVVVQGVSLCIVDVQGVSIYTASIVDVQGVHCTPSTVSS